jgi:hydroxymethylpyrimidine/phosphomethylpyrimidine kinase
MNRSARPRKSSPPVVLTIAGSDSSGGAGIQADLKTFAALGVHGASAITCVVAENPGRVLRVTPLPPARVAEQIAVVLEAFPIAAIKVGMLGSRPIIDAVAKAIAPALKARTPLVIDPAMAASAGGTLLARDALPALKRLMAKATLVTPNRAEAAWLAGRPVDGEDALRAVAIELAADLKVQVLVKGGHGRGREAIDWFASPGGRVHRIAAPRIRGVDPHGTGCTYASAIAAYLARRVSLPLAIGAAKRYITHALRRRVKIGGYDVLNHFP